MITQEIKELEEKLAILKEQARNLPDKLMEGSFEFEMKKGLYRDPTRGFIIQVHSSKGYPYSVFVFENKEYGRSLEDAKLLAQEIIYRYNNFKE